MPELLLHAGPDADVVTIPARTVLAIDGAGAPDRDAFPVALQAIYGVSFTLKMMRKHADPARDFRIGPLEGRWWAEGAAPELAQAPRDSWRWQLRIAMPDDVRAGEVAAAITTATTRKGGKLAGSAAALQVAVRRLPAQRVARALHVGPYADEADTFARMHAALAAAGLAPARSHVEIYLSDPRRTAPARLRTVLLRELG